MLFWEAPINEEIAAIEQLFCCSLPRSTTMHKRSIRKLWPHNSAKWHPFNKITRTDSNPIAETERCKFFLTRQFRPFPSCDVWLRAVWQALHQAANLEFKIIDSSHQIPFCRRKFVEFFKIHGNLNFRTGLLNQPHFSRSTCNFKATLTRERERERERVDRESRLVHNPSALLSSDYSRLLFTGNNLQFSFSSSVGLKRPLFRLTHWRTDSIYW